MNALQSAEWAAHFSAYKEGENGLLMIVGACLYQSFKLCVCMVEKQIEKRQTK